MALGLGEPSRLTKYKRKVAAHPQTKESKKIADDELIFNIEDEELTEPLTQSLTFPSSTKVLTQTGSLKLKKSPNRGRFNSVRAAKHVNKLCNLKKKIIFFYFNVPRFHCVSVSVSI